VKLLELSHHVAAPAQQIVQKAFKLQANVKKFFRGARLRSARLAARENNMAG
jgi:hypothetical protein